MLQHIEIQFTDIITLFEHRNKLARRDQRPVVQPPAECLRTGQTIGLQIDLRLVEHKELFLRNAVSENRFYALAVLLTLHQLRIPEHMGARRLLGGMEGIRDPVHDHTRIRDRIHLRYHVISRRRLDVNGIVLRPVHGYRGALQIIHHELQMLLSEDNRKTITADPTYEFVVPERVIQCLDKTSHDLRPGLSPVQIVDQGETSQIKITGVILIHPALYNVFPDTIQPVYIVTDSQLLILKAEDIDHGGQFLHARDQLRGVNVFTRKHSGLIPLNLSLDFLILFVLEFHSKLLR